MSRPRWLAFLPLLLVLPLAGCEQTRPPSAEGIKKAKERTATGPKKTMLEIDTQPEKLVAQGVTIVNYKVFEPKIDPDGRRHEWYMEDKGFIELQDSVRRNVSERLMRAWVVEEDGSYLGQLYPNYKAYASFLSDFTPPRPGKYVMFVEYQPRKKQDIYDRESARKILTVGGEAADTTPAPVKSGEGTAITVFDASGAATKDQVQVSAGRAVAGKDFSLGWKPPASAGEVEHPEIVAVSPDNQKLLHFGGLRPKVVLPTPGKWRVWFTYQVGGEAFYAPYLLKVG